MLSGYRAMWLMVMFDLPVTTKQNRRDYTVFRNSLLKEGFSQIQYSVYARYCPNAEKTKKYKRRFTGIIPDNGHVRFFTITDRQFGKAEVYYGKTQEQIEKPPPQLLLF
jgi:CRISPR-associated protein Cas2